MASVGLSIWLALNFLAVVVISKKNVAIGILPNLTLVSFATIYIVPILFNPKVSDYFLASVLISNVVLLAFFILASISKANHFDKVRGLENRKTLSSFNFSPSDQIIIYTINIYTFLKKIKP